MSVKPTPQQLEAQRQQLEAQLLASGRITPEQAKFLSQAEAKALYPQKEIVPSKEQIQAEVMAAKQSQEFYHKIGYLQYAGKYEPFEIPKGYQVKEIKETDQGLQVTLEPIPAAPTLTERLEAFTYTPLLQQLGLPAPIRSPADILGIGKKAEPQHLPDIIIAGVSSLESFVKGLGLLARKGMELGLSDISMQKLGIREYILSKPVEVSFPPTAAGGVVSSAILSVQKGQLVASPELEAMMGKSPEYWAGSILADILLSLAMGKVAEEAISPVVGKIKGSAAKWLTESYEESAMAKELWEPSLAERFIMRITGAKPEALPLQIIGLPKMAEAEVLGMENMPKFITGMEAFEWTEAPKAVGLGVTVPIPEVEVSKELGFRVFKAGYEISLPPIMQELRAASRFSLKMTRGEHITPFATTLKKLLEETKGEVIMGRTPLAQAIFAAPEILPKLFIIPEVAAKALPKMAPEILGAGSILALHLIPREVQKPSKEARAKALQAMEPLSKVILSQKQVLGQTTRQIQKQVQKQIQTPRMAFPERQIPTMGFPRLLGLPREEISVSSAILGKKKTAWFYKKHPVPSGREVASHILEGLPKQKRRKK